MFPQIGGRNTFEGSVLPELIAMLITVSNFCNGQYGHSANNTFLLGSLAWRSTMYEKGNKLKCDERI